MLEWHNGASRFVCEAHAGQVGTPKEEQRCVLDFMPVENTNQLRELAETLQRDLASAPRRNCIDGQWVEAASGRTFEVLNPATGRVLARCADSGAEDVDRAVAAARKAMGRNNAPPRAG